MQAMKKMPKTQRQQTIQRQIAALLRDNGYRMEGTLLIYNGIKGWTSERIMGRHSDIVRAAEWLRPIIKETAYSNRLSEILAPV